MLVAPSRPSWERGLGREGVKAENLGTHCQAEDGTALVKGFAVDIVKGLVLRFGHLHVPSLHPSL